jgi:hypothetical protein
MSCLAICMKLNQQVSRGHVLVPLFSAAFSTYSIHSIVHVFILFLPMLPAAGMVSVAVNHDVECVAV